MVALPDKKLLLLEVRDEINRKVSFSAFNFGSKSFLWRDFLFTESWWATLLAARESVFLIQTYTNQDNPDVKTLYGLDIVTRKVLWQKEDFSFTRFARHGIEGLSGRQDPLIVVLDLLTGRILDPMPKLDSGEDEISDPIRPFPYQEGTSYFTTVSKFLSERYEHQPEGTIEYQEHEGLIFISYYMREKSGLVNYLLVMNERGEKLLLEKIDEHLKGLGADTFFILSGCLFFVRNKQELLSYQII